MKIRRIIFLAFICLPTLFMLALHMHKHNSLLPAFSLRCILRSKYACVVLCHKHTLFRSQYAYSSGVCWISVLNPDNTPLPRYLCTATKMMKRPKCLCTTIPLGRTIIRHFAKSKYYCPSSSSLSCCVSACRKTNTRKTGLRGPTRRLSFPRSRPRTRRKYLFPTGS